MSPCVLLFLICVSSLGVSHVRSSDDQQNKVCKDDPPVFSPSHLVVRHGDSTNATCTVCQEKCHNTFFGFESALGKIIKNGTTITWTVDEMTEWDLSVLCYYNIGSVQCSTELLVTVFQPPVRVSFSFVNHSGPLVLGHTYTMQCLVEEVAPVGGVTMVFYKGETQLAQIKIDDQENTPVTKAVQFEYHPVREYHTWDYNCRAILQLGTKSVSYVSTEWIHVETYFPPQLDVPPHPDPLNITEGDPLLLNCSAYGHPRMSYHWTLPSGHIFTGGAVFKVESVSVSDEGRYICVTSNYLGNDTVTYSVFIQRVMTTTTATTRKIVLETTSSISSTTSSISSTISSTTSSTIRSISSTTSSISSTISSISSTSRTRVHRLTLSFMLLFLALV